MEKIPIFDGNEANFADWRFTFEATCGLLGLEEVLRQSVLSTHDEIKPQRLRSAARCLPEEQGGVLSPGCFVPRPSASSCQRSAKACWTHGMASDGSTV